MKSQRILAVFLLVWPAVAACSPSDDLPIIRGAYPGQKPPGVKPEVFEPGIVSKDAMQTKLTVAADGSEIIYCERDPASNNMVFISLRKEGDAWADPVILPFSQEYLNMEPSLSPDGRKLVFVSNRPRSGKGEPEKMPDLWMSEKEGGGWGAPVRFGHPVNTDDPADIEAHPFFGPDGGLYFLRQTGKIRRLYHSARRGGQFQQPRPVPLKEDLHQGQFSGPCVSPDGRVLVMHSRKDGGFGNWDLYVSFKDESGNWAEFRNIGPSINTDQAEGDASFSPDGQYLFFARDGDIFRVSATTLEERPR